MQPELSYLLFLIWQAPLLFAAHRLTRACGLRRWDERLAACGVVWASLAIAICWVLGLAGALAPWPALALGAGIAGVVALATRRAPRASDPGYQPAWCWVERGAIALAGGALLALVYTFAAAPPLGHDSLSYHLHYPACWLQAGELQRLFTPQVESAAVDYFPLSAELLYLWCMLPSADDAAAKLLQLLALGWCVPLISLAARALGAPAGAAALGALLLLVIGPLRQNAQIANSDLLCGAFLLAELALALRAAAAAPDDDDGAPSGGLLLAALAGLALGIGASCKLQGVPLSLAACAGALALTLLGQLRWRQLLVLLLAAAAIGGPSYVWNALETGNPLYPSRLAIAGWVLFDGPLPMGFYPGHEGFSAVTWAYFVGPGPAQLSARLAALLLLALLVNAAACLRQPRAPESRRWLAATLFALGALALTVALIPKLAQRRQLIPALVLLAPQLPLAIGRLAPLGPLAIAAAGLAALALGSPLSLALTAIALPVAAALLAAQRFVPRLEPKHQLLLAGVAGVALYGALAVQQIQGAPARYPIWAHIYGPLGESWQALEELTEDRAEVIAHNSERPYPLLGQGHRHRVLVVPVNAAGAHHLHQLDPPPSAPPDASTPQRNFFLARAMRAPGSYDAWLERLQAAGVTLLFVHHLERERFGEPPIEARWADAHPRRFQPLFRNAQATIYRVR